MIKILFASRLVYEKGVDILIDCIESFGHDTELQNQIEWHICSDGDARETIIELASKYENITYYGRVNTEKMQELYRQADILFMPSRFLETFGLTALEAISSLTPVCAPAKGGLHPFVTRELMLDELSPVASFRTIIEKKLQGGIWNLPNIEEFSEEKWNAKLRVLFEKSNNILIVHDYEEKIGGAEYYIELVKNSLQGLGKNVFFYGYRGQTTVWKRRIMFILSVLAFWRGIALYKILKERQIDTIWMHSILRYIGPWGVLAVRLYCSSVSVTTTEEAALFQSSETRSLHTSRGQKQTSSIMLYLSHHDIGLLAAFPQDITSESSIPTTGSLRSFIPDTNTIKQIVSIGKYAYVSTIKLLLPKDITHIIFAAFLEANIRGQFGKDTKINIFPHKAIGTSKK